MFDVIDGNFYYFVKKDKWGSEVDYSQFKIRIFSDTLESEEIIYHNEFVEDNDIQQTDKTGKKSVQLNICHNQKFFALMCFLYLLYNKDDNIHKLSLLPFVA